jgi:hypothetical protein
MKSIKMKQSLLLSFGLLLLMLGACQPASVEEKDKAKLFAEFYLRIVQGEPLVKGEVSFFEGDSLPAARPRTFKSVMLNNQLMAAKELKVKGTSYRGELNGSVDTTYTFSFINGNDEQKSHQISVHRIKAFLIKDGWKKSTGMTLAWKGAPLSSEENLVLLFTDLDNKSTFIELAGPTTRSEIIVTAAQLKNLIAGKGSLRLVRKTKTEFIDDNHHFINTVEFFTDPIAIHVKE